MINQTKKSSLSDIQRRKKAVTKSLVVALDPDLASSYDEARTALRKLRDKADQPGLSAAQKKELDSQVRVAKVEFETLEADLRENSVEFVMKALKPSELDAIIAANPPTAKQKKEGLDFWPSFAHVPPTTALNFFTSSSFAQARLPAGEARAQIVRRAEKMRRIMSAAP